MHKKINLMLIPLIAGILVACGDAGKGVEPDLAFAKDQAVDSAMTCQFFRHSADDVHQSNASWFLLRTPDRVESYDEASQQSQIWEKDQNGLVSEMRVFHSERLVLEVSNGDLLASGHLPKWATVWSMVDPEELSKNLKLVGVKPLKGIELQAFEGEVDGVATKVEWLSGQALPVSLKRSSARGIDEVHLVGCWAPAKAPMQLTTNEKLLDYRHIDFSDLGDMESDPQVQRISKLLGHGHDHEEEHH